MIRMDDMIVAVDFDGTLFEEDFPSIGKPIYRNIELVRKMQKLGAKTILWTCRNGEPLIEAVLACRKEDLIFDAVNENLPDIIEKWGGDTRKVSATIYLDDRAFGGETVQQLMDSVLRGEDESYA